MATHALQRLLSSPWASPGLLMGVAAAALAPVFAVSGVSFVADLVHWAGSLGLSGGGSWAAMLLMTFVGPGFALGIAICLLLPATAVLVVGFVHRLVLEKSGIRFQVGSANAIAVTFAVIFVLSVGLWYSSAPDSFGCRSGSCLKLQWPPVFPILAFCIAQAVMAVFAARLVGRRKERAPDASNS